MSVIALLTDFGTRDSYVGEVRGRLLTLAPGSVLADVTHEIPPGDVRAACYVLGRTWQAFPAGTVHLAVVDPGVGSARRALALRARGHYFVGPDNGLFTPVLDRCDLAVELAVPRSAAATFHGRDVFAPAAAALASGLPPEALGTPLEHAPMRLPLPVPSADGASLLGEVLYIDRFGTLITNLPADTALAASVEVAGTAVPLRRTFSDVAAGELVAIAGSGGTIEIALRDGSAAERLGAAIGTRVRAARGGEAP